MKEKKVNNLAKLSRSGTPKAKLDQTNKGGDWVTSIVMILMLPFLVGFIIGLYFLVEALDKPIAITVIIGLITFVGWVILGGIVGNWVKNRYEKGV